MTQRQREGVRALQYGGVSYYLRVMGYTNAPAALKRLEARRLVRRTKTGGYVPVKVGEREP